MSKRDEFSKAIMVEVAKRATREIRVGERVTTDQYCEECGEPTKGRFEIDHINPCGLTGKATIDNARLLCIPCHKEKTKGDKGDIAKAKRREAGKLHVRKRSGRPMQKPPVSPLRAEAKPGKIAKPPVSGLSEIARRYGVRA